MATYSWTSGVSGDWNTAANWTPGTVPNAAGDDVVIDANPTLGMYTVTLAANETKTVNSLLLNNTDPALSGSNSAVYNAAKFELDGTLIFAPGSAGLLGGSLQTFVHVASGMNAQMVNAGLTDGFIQVEGNLLVTGTNGFYCTNYMQALSGTITIDTSSIAEMSGNTLFDGIYEAKGQNAAVFLGGKLGGDIVNIATIVGPPGNAVGWTELSINGPGAVVDEWNGTSYVSIETSLKEIDGGGTLDVLSGQNFTSANTLTITSRGTNDGSGMLHLQAGTFTTAGITINGGIVEGSATIVGDVLNAGTVIAFGGTLDLTGALTGTGIVLFDREAYEVPNNVGTINPVGATLIVNSVAAGQTITMNGDDTLQINALGSFAGTIVAKVGDTIVLHGQTVTSAVVNGGSLVLSNGGTTIGSLNLAGSYAGNSFTTNGSIITIGASSPNFTITDTTTNTTTTVAGSAYSGPVAGLQWECIDITSANINITATVPNVFLRSGSGMDGLNVSQSNGNNILDGSTGSNFLTGGTGNDTFYIDGRNPDAPVFSTVVNFHSGDEVTIWGVNQTDFSMLTLENEGAVGFKGVDLLFSKPGQSDVSFVLTGWTGADLTNGKLTSFYGKTADIPGLPGSQFMTIHAN